ncbi:MAG: hypothetical protein R3F43_13430 [bacterium]
MTARAACGQFASLFLAQHQVRLIDAFDMLDDDLQGTLRRSDRAVAVRNRLLGAKKICTATHGIATDVDNCFASAAGGVALCDFHQLARFMLALLPVRDTHNLALVMCYGARTSDLPHDAARPAGHGAGAGAADQLRLQVLPRALRHRKLR